MTNELDRAPAEMTPAAPTLVDRIVRQVGLSSSAETVFGAPVAAHGYTVVPVARVYFLYGGGSGPELAGRLVDRAGLSNGPVSPALSAGGGGGGLGVARPAGYIEMSAQGTRFVPVRRDWRRPLVFAGLAALAWLARRRA